MEAANRRARAGALRVAGGVRVVAGGVRAVAAVGTGRSERNGTRTAHEHGAHDGADDGRVTHWQPFHDFLTTPATAVFAGRSVSGFIVAHLYRSQIPHLPNRGGPHLHHKCRPTSARKCGPTNRSVSTSRPGGEPGWACSASARAERPGARRHVR